MHELNEKKIKAPENYRYNEEYLWMEYSEPDLIKCGITDYLCEKTGEIITIEYARNILNMSVNSGDAVLLVESLRDSLIIKAPFPGVITDINKNCTDTPDLLNNDPYGEGWLFLLSPDDVYDFERQMQSDEYEYMVIKEKEDLDFF